MDEYESLSQLANARLQLWHLLIAAVETDALKFSFVLFERHSPDVVPFAQNRDLSVLHRLGIRHANHIQRGEVRTENACAVVQPLVWNHEDKDTVHQQPAVCALGIRPPCGDSQSRRFQNRRAD